MRPGNQEQNSGYNTTQLVHDNPLWAKDGVIRRDFDLSMKKIGQIEALQ
jgi:hypothetical protein